MKRIDLFSEVQGLVVSKLAPVKAELVKAKEIKVLSDEDTKDLVSFYARPIHRARKHELF